MNEKIIEQLLQYMEQSKDFILQEAPELIKEILLYEKISSWSSLIASAFFMGLSLTIFFYSWFYAEFDKYEHLKIEWVFARLFSIGIFFLSFIPFSTSFERLIRIHFAPKYLLINIILQMKG